MATESVTKTLGAVTRRVPGLRRVPVIVLISTAEVALLGDAVARLSPVRLPRRLVYGRR